MNAPIRVVGFGPMATKKASSSSAVTVNKDDERILDALAWISESIREEIAKRQPAKRQALAHALTMATMAALDGRLDDHADEVMRFIGGLGEGLAVFTVNKQTEAKRIGGLVASCVELRPIDDDQIESGYHTLAVTEEVVSSLETRLTNSSVFWKQHLPDDWKSPERRRTALSKVRKAIEAIPDCSKWGKPDSRAKIARAYLRAVGVPENLFRNDEF